MDTKNKLKHNDFIEMGLSVLTGIVYGGLIMAFFVTISWYHIVIWLCLDIVLVCWSYSVFEQFAQHKKYYILIFPSMMQFIVVLLMSSLLEMFYKKIVSKKLKFGKGSWNIFKSFFYRKYESF